MAEPKKSNWDLLRPYVIGAAALLIGPSLLGGETEARYWEWVSEFPGWVWFGAALTAFFWVQGMKEESRDPEQMGVSAFLLVGAVALFIFVVTYEDQPARPGSPTTPSFDHDWTPSDDHDWNPSVDSNWNPNVDSNWSPSVDLDCSDIGREVYVAPGSDSHGFDADNDGVGCEGW
jgi:hypothetical protein